MNKLNNKQLRRFIYFLTTIAVMACVQSGQKKQNKEEDMTNYEKGTFGYDVTFFANHQIPTIELKDESSKACLLIVPGYQGRVMTSSANGMKGASFGWINYKLIESGKVNPQFNPYGGEERLWLGPEGGPFSVYFRKGKEQVYSNWIVPKEIDTKPFEVTDQTPLSVSFKEKFTLTNALGTDLKVGIERTVKLLNQPEVEQALQLSVDSSLSYVAYESENTLINNNTFAWTEQSGVLSLWLLSMFNPSEKGVVFVPFRKGNENELGRVVTDDYFGKVPSDRLLVKDGILYFKTDGKHRSKIGISPERALPFCGSYDPIKQVLTLLWFSKPEKETKYVNSKWDNRENLLSGDAVNSYNDGPVEDGTIMGPFYEIESSSSAALLSPGEKMTHRQRIFHIMGDEARLSAITEKLFSVPLSAIKEAFQK